jgi:uncharacterized membrane protein YdfJ with MMPL/SSD domain
MLRRVTQTLSALAATGGFDPDPPGALSADRDPPGFEAVGIGGLAPVPVATKALDAEPQTEQEAAARRAQEQAEQRRVEAEQARITAERQRVEAALRTARGEVAARERAVTSLESQLRDARDAVEAARGIVRDLEQKLDE